MLYSHLFIKTYNPQPLIQTSPSIGLGFEVVLMTPTWIPFTSPNEGFPLMMISSPFSGFMTSLTTTLAGSRIADPDTLQIEQWIQWYIYFIFPNIFIYLIVGDLWHFKRKSVLIVVIDKVFPSLTKRVSLHHSTPVGSIHVLRGQTSATSYTRPYSIVPILFISVIIGEML